MRMKSLYMLRRKGTRKYEEESYVALIAVYRDYLPTFFRFPCYSQMSIALQRQTRHKKTAQVYHAPARFLTFAYQIATPYQLDLH